MLRRVLFAVLALAVLALVGAVVMLVPILTHESAGDSGQQVPEGFATQATATGADGRTRTLSLTATDGTEIDPSQLQPGDELLVHGTGFDSDIGIYVSICAVPEIAHEKPTPCLGGLPEGAMDGEAAGRDTFESSIWITNDWAWSAFATKRFDDAATGSFEARLLVPAATQEGLDCTVTRCAVTTRADHTASSDRVQDMQLPVGFSQ